MSVSVQVGTQGGRCRVCGCTEERPCQLSTGGGETCAWLDATRTVCTRPGCVRAAYFANEREIAALARADRERYMARRMRAREKRLARRAGKRRVA